MPKNEKISEEPDFERDLRSLMARLIEAGMVKGYEIPNDPDEPLGIQWRDDYLGMGGKAAFLGLARMLQDICPRTPLTQSDQAMIQMLYPTLFEDRRN